MKCEECIKKGRISKVYIGMSSVTAVYCQPYYDENGVYKCDDCNTTTTEYTCSNGHRFIVKT